MPTNDGQAEIEVEVKNNTELATPAADIPAIEHASALTVVAIGASAGGVRALQDFFANIPAASGLAYVVVLHLSPEHESHLAEIIGRETKIPVEQVVDAVKLKPNHAYVIPPSKHLRFEDGMLRLSEPTDQPRGQRVAIDRCFRSLAETHGPQSTAVVLSGTGADGALGLKLVKELGGLAVAQDPMDAEYEGMPRSAIATGMIDYILPAKDIATQIVAYVAASARMRLPAEAAPSAAQAEEGPIQELALRDILSHVRAQTGHDFTYYKRATILRRIGRRLQVNNRENLHSYLEFLRRHPTEVGALVKDLLISVTQFFRDPSAWQTLQTEVIPRLFENRGPEDTLRAWVCGCATGEEAYTLAILLSEEAQKRERPPHIQIFATDIDVDAIARARAGVYPETIAGDIAPDRLRRWFNRYDGGQYQVKKELRELVLFAAHNVLRDTPFSRLDLVTCRNLLIYLTREAQERVFDTFHFALRPDGRLLLGPSESADGVTPLFAPTDKQYRLYLRRPIPRPIPSSLPPDFPGLMVPSLYPVAPVTVSPIAAAVLPIALPATAFGRSFAAPERHLQESELHRGLLELYAPPSVLVTAEHDVIHLSEGVGRFLRLAGGTPTNNLLRLVLPSLRIELRASLYAAVQGERDQVRVIRNVVDDEDTLEDPTLYAVRVTVRPVRYPEAVRGYFLVLFEALSEEAARTAGVRGPLALPQSGPGNREDLELARHLESEIARLQALLGGTIKQYESSTEELKASNEELQAMNEELRSTAEELETSKEELQSVNEELTTLNVELKVRVDEVSRTNGDLQNLLAATDIATVFLDRGLRVQRYTPAAEALFNIIPTDVGRPLAHLTHRLEYPAMSDDAGRVLESLAPQESEVRSDDGRWFLARLRPYRTPDDHIDGAVIAFLDITDRKAAEESLRQANEELLEAKRDLERRVEVRTAQLGAALSERRDLLMRVVTAQEDERRRISRELHDQMGQLLTSFAMGIKSLESALSNENAPAMALPKLAELGTLAREMGSEVHRIATELRPTVLDDLGLVPALETYIAKWSENAGIAADFVVLGADGAFQHERMTPMIETIFYRVIQEALTNVLRHAGPDLTSVSVTLQRFDSAIQATIEDDGIGFDPDEASNSGRLGLAGMRERAALVDGTLDIESQPGHGTTVFLRVPGG